MEFGYYHGYTSRKSCHTLWGQSRSHSRPETWRPLLKSSEAAPARQRWDYFWLILLLLILGLGSAALVRAQALPQLIFGHDCSVFYDGGWRAYNGIKPHVDFYSPLGPVSYLYVALGYVLFGPNVNSLAYINALALPVIGGLVWGLLRNRIPPFWLLWASLLTGFCFVSAHHLRLPLGVLSYGGLYNHQGYAGLLFLGFLLFAPQGRAGMRQLWINAFVAGAIVSLLFFLKISYFIAAAPLLLAYALLSVKPRPPLSGIIAGFSLVTFLILAYLDFNVGGMLRDLSIAAHARAHLVNLIDPVHHLHGMEWQLLAMLLIGLASSAPKLSRDLTIIFASFLLSGFLAYESNLLFGPYDEIPVFAGFSILCAVRLQTAGYDESEARYKAVIGLCCLIFVGIYFVPDARSLWVAASLRASEPVPLETFDSDSMRSLKVDGLGGGLPHPDTYVAKINDGLALIRQAGLEHEACFTLDFTNPFPFALRSPPPRGGATFWQENFSFARDSYPAPALAFRGVDILMIPKFPEIPWETPVLLEIYGPYIASHFIPVAESKHWRLLKNIALK